MALFRTRAEDVEELEGPRARVTIYRVGRTTLVTQAVGHPEIEHVELLIRRSEALMAEVGVIDIVHDWFGVTGYSSDIRPRMTPWAKATNAQHRGIHIGTSSRLVRMGVTMVKLFSDAPLHAYDSVQDLERVLAAIVTRGG